MIDKAQEDRITDYLVSQNLSLDILVEIRDHMAYQIADLEWDENLSFEEAFSKAKESWKGEFKMVNYWLFFPTKLPLIARRIISEKYNQMLKYSLSIGILSLGINILLVYLSKTEEMYTILFRIFNSLFLVVLAGMWILNFKIRKYMSAEFKYRGKCFYTLYQKNIGLVVGCTIGMMQVISKSGHYAYEFFKNQDHSNIWMVFVTLFFPLILEIFSVFAIFNFYEHKRNLSKMQSFLTPTAY